MKLDGELERLLRKLSGPLPASTQLRRVRIHASHDLALIRARDLLAGAHDIKLELEVLGGLDSLDSLARRQCELAGFHVSHGDNLAELVHDAMRGTLHTALQLVEVVDRQQGLMFRSGTSLPLASLRDLARSGARFINRQRGSGTRLLFDRLLHEAGLWSSDIRGYGDEEFTHLAVAATVAGAGADAGFGIQAAAAQFGLRFVPLARDTYYLACSEKDANEPNLHTIFEFLRQARFREACGEMPGYDASRAGRARVFRA